MAIPDFQSFLLPVLQICSDEQEHSIRETVEIIASHFGLTEDDRKELLPSGAAFRLDNRISWARTYLKRAGLLESTGRSKFRVTPRGIDVLNSNPAHIDNNYLRQFPEFREFQSKPAQVEAPGQVEEESVQTPQELLDSSYQSLRNVVAQEIIDRIMACSPRFFEKPVVDLLVSMGYGGSIKDAGRAIGQSGDGGIDGTINEDRLGLDVVYIQAKRWEGTVGRPIVQAFAGSLEGERARKGVLITTSTFSKDAREYVKRIEKKIVLIDGEQLAQFMIDYGIGVTIEETYVVKKVDLDYFDEG